VGGSPWAKTTSVPRLTCGRPQWESAWPIGPAITSELPEPSVHASAEGDTTVQPAGTLTAKLPDVTLSSAGLSTATTVAGGGLAQWCSGRSWCGGRGGRATRQDHGHGHDRHSPELATRGHHARRIEYKMVRATMPFPANPMETKTGFERPGTFIRTTSIEYAGEVAGHAVKPWRTRQ
jgi:hypothetical protein